MLPAVFVSHGSPLLPLTEAPATHFLRSLPHVLGVRPRAIVVASAHWETRSPEVTATSGTNDTIHDFYGFPPALYRLRYPAPGDPALARRIAGLLSAAGFAAREEERRGLDHGAWVPLMLGWPDADIPVLQVSLQTPLGPAHHLAVGQALAALREEDVLLFGSGSFSHNLMAIGPFRDDPDGTRPSPEWVGAFCDWMDHALTQDRKEDLIAYRERAPHAARNHPSEEHLLPLFVAMGAGGAARRLHRSQTYSVLRMDAYAFD